MDMLWKWIMRLNAKAFCLVALILFVATASFCYWQFTHPMPPFKDGENQLLPDAPQVWTIGTLDFVTNQLASESLIIPVDPFRPTIEQIFTNEVERAAFLKALKAAQENASGIAKTKNGKLANTAAGEKDKNPFAHLRKKKAVQPDGLRGPDGQQLVIPKLTFIGFFQRPDGKQAAMFHDSTEQTSSFYDAGKSVHGVEILSADVRKAKIRFPDGTTRDLAIGSSIELAPEPAKQKPIAKPVAKTTPAAQGKAVAKVKPAAQGKAVAKKQPQKNPPKK